MVLADLKLWRKWRFGIFILSLALINFFPHLAFGEWTEVTSSFNVVRTRPLYDFVAKDTYCDVSLTNISNKTYHAPIRLIINITNSQVTVRNADGITDDGKPYFNYGSLFGADNKAEPNETSSPRQIRFYNPNRLRFDFTTEVRIEVAAPTNQKPVANAGQNQIISLQSGQTSALVQLDGSGSYDLDGHIVKYSWTGNPDPQDIANPTLSLSPGTYIFILVVTDDKGAESEPSTVTITVLSPINNPPILIVPGPQSVAERGSLSFTVSSSDPDNDPLTISASNIPRGASFNSTTGIFNWVPDFDQAGTYKVIFSVSDGKIVVEKSVNITVVDTNRAPTIKTAQLTEGRVDQKYQASIEAVDPDGDLLSFELLYQPEGMSINPVSGILSWKPNHSQIGEWGVGVRVSDGKGGSDTRDYKLTVPDTIPPSIFLNAPKTAIPGASFTAVAEARDNIGISEVIISIEGQSPVAFDKPPYQQQVTLSPTLAIGSAVKIKAEAIDLAGNTGKTTAKVKIVSIPDTEPPAAKLNAPETTSPGSTLLISAQVSDDSGVSQLTFFINGEPIGTSTPLNPIIEYKIPEDIPPGVPLEISIKAEDFSGNVSEVKFTSQITETPDTTPPSASIAVPEKVSEGEPIRIALQIKDDTIVSKIEIFVDHTLVATLPLMPEEGWVEIKLPEHLSAGMDALVEVIVTDSSGNQTQQTQSFNIKGPGKGILRGEIYNDQTGLPLKGALITFIHSDGTIVQETSNDKGGYSIQVKSGSGKIKAEYEGFTVVNRTGFEILENRATEIIDIRLTPLSPKKEISSVSGGEITIPFDLFTSGYIPVLKGKGVDPATIPKKNILLQIPGGALQENKSISLNQVSPQGLEGLLPAGWSPLATIDIHPRGIGFIAEANLTIPNLLGVEEGDKVILAFYNEEKDIWVKLRDVSINNNTISASIPSTGQYAFLLPDLTPKRPPEPLIGEEIRGVPLDTLPEKVTTKLIPDPKILFYKPGVKSEVGLIITPENTPLSSGVRVQTVISEEYNFYSGAKINLNPFNEDIILYSFNRFPLTAAYPVTPSLEFEPMTLQKGIITVDIISPSARGLNVIGPEGGTIRLPTGEELVIPKTALLKFIPVELNLFKAEDLRLPLPDGIEFIKGLNIDLAGYNPVLPLHLSIPLPSGIPSGQILLLRMVEILGATRFVLSGLGAIEGNRIVTIYEINDGKNLRFPGILDEGRYLIVGTTKDIGFSTGRVFGVTGDPLPQALLLADTTSIVSLSRRDGDYTSLLPLGLFTLSAVNPVTLDKGSRGGGISNPGEIITLDISLREEPPAVVAIEPANNAVNVPLAASIKVKFSEPIDPSTLTTNHLILSSPQGIVTGSVERRAGNLEAVFRPIDPLDPNTEYTFTVTTGIKDLAGYSLPAPYTIKFKSLDTIPPPPPPAGNITATIPDADGKTIVSATQGSAGVHDTVTVINKTKNISMPALVNPDGSFSTTIKAGLTDKLVISIKDRAGNETTVSIDRFRNPDGSTVIGPEGGKLEAENGVILDIPPGTFPKGAIVRIKALSESNIPVSPGPNFPFVAAFEYKSSVNPQKYITISTPLPPNIDPMINSGIVAKVVNFFGGEPHLSIIDTAKVENGRLTTSSPPCPGLTGYYSQIALYLNRMALMAQIQARVFFTAMAGGSMGFVSYLTGMGVGAALASIEILNTNLQQLYPFLSTPESGNPYACMLIPPEEEFKAVIRDPETREVIDYIDIEPIEPFGHAHFSFSVYKKEDIIPPLIVGIEPVNRILDPTNKNRITLKFSEPIDHIYLLGQGLKDIYLTLKDNDSIYYSGQWELKENNTLLVFEPSKQLPMGKSFILHLENIKDLAGNSYLGTNIELRTFDPTIIYPTENNQLSREKIAIDLGSNIDEIPDTLWFHDLDYSTISPERSYDGRWHTDIIAIQYPDYTKSGWNTYRLFKIDATNPTNPIVKGAFKTDSRYTQRRIKFLDDIPIPPRSDFWGDPWWKRKQLIRNSKDPSIKLCWDPQSLDDQVKYNQWYGRHCKEGCEVISGGCGDLAVVIGEGKVSSGASYSMIFPYEMGNPENISWIGWRYLSDDGRGYTIRPDAPVGRGYPLGLEVVPHMDITHGGRTHSDTIGAFVANKNIGVQLVDLGLNMPGIDDDERKNTSLEWAPVERLHMIGGANYTDIALAPPRKAKDGRIIPPRIVALATDRNFIRNLEIFTLGLGSSPTGSKSLTRIPEHLAIAANIPVRNFETDEITYRDIAIITTAKETGGGLLIYEIPDDGSSPSAGSYIEMPVGTKFVDVDSRAQLAYIGASGVDGATDLLLIVDISNPFSYVGDEDKDGWNDRVIARIPLNIPGYPAPVYSHGLKVDPDRGLVYIAIYADGKQGLMIVKVKDCPDLAVDFKEVKRIPSLPEDVLKQGIEQVIRYAISGSGIPQGSLSVIAYNEGACLWKGVCPLNTEDLKYRFALLIPESEWSKKDLLINTLRAQVRDESGDPKKVILEGTDVYAVYEDIEFVPLKYEEFIKANLGLDYNEFDFGLARQSLLLKILLTGIYIDTIPGVKPSPIPLSIILSNLTTPCPREECGVEEPSYVWRQEGYEILRLNMSRFYKDGLLIRIMGEFEKGTSLYKKWRKDVKEAASMALRAIFARMISTENGNQFLSLRAKTYGIFENGIAISQIADPNQWEFKNSIENFEHWIATMAALSVKENIGVFFADEIVSNVFDFLAVFNGKKIFEKEDEANVFIAKCYNFIKQELNGIPWSVYQAKLINDPRASQRNLNNTAIEGKINEFSSSGEIRFIPRFFNKGSGRGSAIPVRMHIYKEGSWSESVKREIDVESGFETALPLNTFKIIGINQTDPLRSDGWVGFTIDLPEKKMRDGDRKNNFTLLYYYVLDTMNPGLTPGVPLVPLFSDPDGTLFLADPECACDSPEIKIRLDINGLDHVEINPGDCVNLNITLENIGCKDLKNITLHSNLPDLGDILAQVEKIDPDQIHTIQIPYCPSSAVYRFIKGYVWFEESDPRYEPIRTVSNPVEILIPKARLHVDGKANGKDEVVVKKGSTVAFNLDLSTLDLRGCSSSSIAWDMGDRGGIKREVTETEYTFNSGGTYIATVSVKCDDIEEMDRIPVHVVDIMRIDINGTEDQEDDLVMLRSSLPNHEPVQGVERIQAVVRLQKPLRKAIPIKIKAKTEDIGKIGFPDENKYEVVLTVPANKDSVEFSIGGYQGSITKDDVTIQVTLLDSDEILAEENITVFWFDKNESYVKVIPVGSYKFEMGKLYADPYAVIIKAWAKLMPQGLNCSKEPLKNLNVGIVQNIIESRDTKNLLFSGVIWKEGVPSGTTVFLPNNIEHSVSLNSLVDSLEETLPLYSFFGNENIGLLYKIAIQCFDPGVENRMEALATDNPWLYHIPFPDYPAKDDHGNIVGRVIYTLTSLSTKNNFKVWAVIWYKTGEKDVYIKEIDKIKKVDIGEVVDTVSVTKWSLDVDSTRAGEQKAYSDGVYSKPSGEDIPILLGPTANYCLNNPGDSKCAGKAEATSTPFNPGAVIKP